MDSVYLAAVSLGRTAYRRRAFCGKPKSQIFPCFFRGTLIVTSQRLGRPYAQVDDRLDKYDADARPFLKWHFQQIPRADRCGRLERVTAALDTTTDASVACEAAGFK